ncbi:MAG: hypothetical protein K8R07_09750, partial [Desulfobacterales bacterium]|nr:hypothetical protein [Desulfobacterales bacterium]
MIVKNACICRWFYPEKNPKENLDSYELVCYLNKLLILSFIFLKFIPCSELLLFQGLTAKR